MVGFGTDGHQVGESSPYRFVKKTKASAYAGGGLHMLGVQQSMFFKGGFWWISDSCEGGQPRMNGRSQGFKKGYGPDQQDLHGFTEIRIRGVLLQLLGVNKFCPMGHFPGFLRG